MARGAAYSRARRALGKDSFVILDGMNYIKGFRYQLWCEAKAAGTSCCVVSLSTVVLVVRSRLTFQVHIGTPVDRCVANNEARLKRQAEQKEKPEEQQETAEDEPYPPELLDNLIFRYEEPSTHSRWDKPLFTVPWFDEQPPIADIWTALTGIPHPSTPTDPITNPTPTATTPQVPSDTASIATTTTAARTTTTAPTRPKIKPHAATMQPSTTTSSALYDFEKTTSAIISSIRTFTLSNPSASTILANLPPTAPQGITIPIPVPGVTSPIFIPADTAALEISDELAGAGGVLALPKLQRLKRQWIGLNRAYVGGNYDRGKGGLSSEQVGDAFVRFLNADFAGDADA